MERINSLVIKATHAGDWGPGVWYVDRDNQGGAFSASFDEYVGQAVQGSDKPWPIILHALSLIHLDTNNKRINGSLFSLFALVDRRTPLTLKRGVQSPWDEMTWTGYLPLFGGFGAWFEQLNVVATDKFVMSAVYTTLKGERHV